MQSEITQKILDTHFSDKTKSDAEKLKNKIKKENPLLELEKIVILGDAKAQTRPRAAARGKHVKIYEDPKMRDWKIEFMSVLNNMLPEKFIPGEGEVRIDIKVFVLPPKKFSDAKTFLAESGFIRPTKKPDFDNIAKSIVDASKNVLWKDDKQITFARIEKFYSLKPRMEIQIRFRQHSIIE